MPKMTEERPWQEFVDARLFWWVNRSLHLFGWALVREEDQEGNITRVYPARCAFRGFDEKTEEEGFTGLTHYLQDNIEGLVGDVENEELPPKEGG